MAQISRRDFLHGLACSAAAHPLMSTMTFAQAPGDARLVVIVLRGAMDGLGILPPVGDVDFAVHRPKLSRQDTLPLTEMFGVHTAFQPLMPLWEAGELGFVHAVSTPYRDKRSHFDGQDLLEAGTGMDVGINAVRDGWLNRLLQALPGTQAETAFAVGRDEMRILRGGAPFYQWAPDVAVEVSPQAQLLLNHAYAPDPLFSSVAGEALELAATIEPEGAGDLSNGQRAEPLAAFAASRLLEQARIASYSLTGWDTHRNQVGGLRGAMGRLQRSILTLKETLGPVWDQTAVMAVTEFGRTVRENGSNGTDHGTAGAMVYAGGALKGGQVLGDWPGLEESALYARRDLLPTGDVRRYAGWAMRDMFGIDRSVIEDAVFPGLDLEEKPRFVL